MNGHPNQTYFTEIKEYDSRINAIMLKELTDESELTDADTSELDKQSQYALTITTELAKLKKILTPIPP